MVNVKKAGSQAADYAAIENYLLTVDLLGCFATVSTVNEMYGLFIHITHDTIDRFVPIRKIGHSTFVRSPSYDRRMIRRRNTLWSFAISNGLGNESSVFIKYNAVVEGCVNRYHVFLKKKIVDTKSPSKLFTFISSRIKDKTVIPALIADNGNMLFSDRDKAELVGQHFQKNFLNHPGNYRPISITSVFAKVFEKILRKHIVKHLEHNNIIPSEQHGFCRGRSGRKGKGRETALLVFLSDWTKAIELKKQVHIIYFDFKKAFDKVPIQKLVGKLRAVGIHPRVVQWIQHFLTASSVPRFGLVTTSPRGVPQGGVLFPLLFLVYRFDLPKALSNLGVKCQHKDI
ncbi:hypothetical protein OSTOST_14885 [Ostertagia ostertagi]